MAGEFDEVLCDADAHKYLGRELSGQLGRWSAIELDHRFQTAWVRFHKHRDILLDKDLNMCSRLQFFKSVVSSTVLFALSACALSAAQVQSLDVLQRKVHRSMVGWSRHDGEPWSETIARRKQRLSRL